MPQLNKRTSPIAYSCYSTRSREGEQFIPEHVFGYQVSGTMIMNDGNKEYIFNPGIFRFGRRNHLVKFNKLPPDGGEYKSLSVQFDQPFLRNLSMEAGIMVRNRPVDTRLIRNSVGTVNTAARG